MDLRHWCIDKLSNRKLRQTLQVHLHGAMHQSIIQHWICKIQSVENYQQRITLFVSISRMKGKETPQVTLELETVNKSFVFKLFNVLLNLTHFNRAQIGRDLESENFLNRLLNQLPHEDMVKISKYYYISLFSKIHLFDFCQIPALFMSSIPSVGLQHFQTPESTENARQLCENSMSGVIHHCVKLASTLSQ